MRTHICMHAAMHAWLLHDTVRMCSAHYVFTEDVLPEKHCRVDIRPPIVLYQHYLSDGNVKTNIIVGLCI